MYNKTKKMTQALIETNNNLHSTQIWDVELFLKHYTL